MCTDARVVQRGPMLATPHALTAPREVRLIGECRFTPRPQVGAHRDAQLESAKAAVGSFRVRWGEPAWRERVAATDRPATISGARPNPASRAYYKLAEIMRTCALAPDRRTLHLCDAPGGFAQAVRDWTPTVKEVVVTSRRSSGSILFAPSVVRDDACVVELQDLAHGADLLRASVRDQIAAAAPASDLVTADGAVDNDAQPDLAEVNNARLLAAEVLTVLRAQREGGSCVIKVFSIAADITRECIALLAYCYQATSLIKPDTSRAVNDERYVVCQCFSPAKAAEFHALHLPDEPCGACLVSLGIVADPAWYAELDRVVHHMNLQQLRAINAALTCTSPAAAPPSHRKPGRSRPGDLRPAQGPTERSTRPRSRESTRLHRS